MKSVRSEIKRYVDEVVAPGMGQAIGQIGREIERRCAAQIAELRDQFKFTGTWEQEKVYKSGNVVEIGGSVWIANTDTAARPGSDAKAWTLIAPRARDGRDGRDGVPQPLEPPPEPPEPRTVRSNRR